MNLVYSLDKEKAELTVTLEVDESYCSPYGKRTWREEDVIELLEEKNLGVEIEGTIQTTKVCNWSSPQFLNGTWIFKVKPKTRAPSVKKTRYQPTAKTKKGA